jgi:hypothetical protein
LPNCFSMAAIAPDTAFIFSLMLDMVSPRGQGVQSVALVEHAICADMRHPMRAECQPAPAILRVQPAAGGRPSVTSSRTRPS